MEALVEELKAIPNTLEYLSKLTLFLEQHQVIFHPLPPSLQLQLQSSASSRPEWDLRYKQACESLKSHLDHLQTLDCSDSRINAKGTRRFRVVSLLHDTHVNPKVCNDLLEFAIKWQDDFILLNTTWKQLVRLLIKFKQNLMEDALVLKLPRLVDYLCGKIISHYADALPLSPVSCSSSDAPSTVLSNNQNSITMTRFFFSHLVSICRVYVDVLLERYFEVVVVVMQCTVLLRMYRCFVFF